MRGTTWRISIFAVLLALGAAMPASAATPPANDTPAGAIELPSTLPQTVTQDLSGATLDGTSCEGGSASVWYAFTPEEDGGVDITATSDLSPIRISMTSQAPIIGAACTFGDPFSFPMFGGTRYLIEFSGAAGAVMTAHFARDPRTVQLTIRPVAIVLRDGSVTIGGTYVCTAPTGPNNIQVTVGQSGRSGVAFTGGDCSQTSTPWSARVYPETGRFHAGAVQVSVAAVACSIRYCTAGQAARRSIALPLSGR
jgi:hypothetical protein